MANKLHRLQKGKWEDEDEKALDTISSRDSTAEKND
jgi:hypothetical protein